MDHVEVVNSDAPVRVEGVLDLKEGSNLVDASAWAAAKANPVVKLYLESGRLKELRAEDPEGDAKRKRARG